MNTTAVIELPATAAGAYVVRGPGGAKATRLDAPAGLVRFRVGSGTWSFSG